LGFKCQEFNLKRKQERENKQLSQKTILNENKSPRDCHFTKVEVMTFWLLQFFCQFDFNVCNWRAGKVQTSSSSSVFGEKLLQLKMMKNLVIMKYIHSQALPIFYPRIFYPSN